MPKDTIIYPYNQSIIVPLVLNPLSNCWVVCYAFAFSCRLVYLLCYCWDRLRKKSDLLTISNNGVKSLILPLFVKCASTSLPAFSKSHFSTKATNARILLKVLSLMSIIDIPKSSSSQTALKSIFPNSNSFQLLVIFSILYSLGIF